MSAICPSAAVPMPSMYLTHGGGPMPLLGHPSQARCPYAAATLIPSAAAPPPAAMPAAPLTLRSHMPAPPHSSPPLTAPPLTLRCLPLRYHASPGPPIPGKPHLYPDRPFASPPLPPLRSCPPLRRCPPLPCLPANPLGAHTCPTRPPHPGLPRHLPQRGGQAAPVKAKGHRRGHCTLGKHWQGVMGRGSMGRQDKLWLGC